LKATGDPRQVVSDPGAQYGGGRIEDRSLVPLGEARLGRIGLEEWLRRSQAAAWVRIRQANEGPMKLILRSLIVAALPFAAPLAQTAPQPVVVPVMQKDLADTPGKEMLMLTVEYPPGAVEHIHRHDAYAFVYVLEGTIVEQVRGGKEVTLTPGQTFYEGPNDVHTVGRNASTTKPAKFVVVMVKKKGVDAVLPAE
jgi:quercetin dioxygenase-like cupin family protein